MKIARRSSSQAVHVCRSSREKDGGRWEFRCGRGEVLVGFCRNEEGRSPPARSACLRAWLCNWHIYGFEGSRERKSAGVGRMHAWKEFTSLKDFLVGAVLTGPRAHVAWFVHRGRLSCVKRCLSAGLERKYIVPAVVLILLPSRQTRNISYLPI